MILCPKCKATTRTVETRETHNGTRRRLRCTKCKHRVTTLELIVNDARAAILDPVIVPRAIVETIVGAVASLVVEADEKD